MHTIVPLWDVGDLFPASPFIPPGGVGQIPIPIGEPTRFALRDAGAAHPWSRLQNSLYLPVLSDAARHLFRFTTGAAPYATSIGGWAYLVNPPVEPSDQLQRLEESAGRLAAGEPEALIERWHTRWQPSVNERLRRVVPGELDELIALFRRVHDIRFRLRGACLVLGGEVVTPVREEAALRSLLRDVLLGLGGRLAAEGLIERADDVWHLPLGTALAGTGLLDEARLGRGQLAWAAAHPGPASYGPAPAPFRGAGLPEPSAGARRVIELTERLQASTANALRR